MNIFNNVINDDFDYIMESMGQDLFIDNKLTTAWVKNNKTVNGYTEREVISEVDFSRGSIIDYLDNRYLIMSNDIEREYEKYHKGNMRLVNDLTYFKIGDKHYFFPSVLETSGMALKTLNGGLLNLADGVMVVNLQDNAITRQLKHEDKFYSMGWGWEITGMDYSYKGLIKLHVNKSTISSDLKTPPEGTVEYPSRPTDPSIVKGSITIKYMASGSQVADTVLQSDLDMTDHLINSKVIEGYDLVGSTSIIVTLTEDNPNQEVVFEYEEAEEELPDVLYTIKVAGVDYIDNSEDKKSQYTAVVKADGVVASDVTVLWEVKKQGGGVPNATIDASGLLTVNYQESENITITAKLESYPLVSDSLNVEIFDNNDW